MTLSDLINVELIDQYDSKKETVKDNYYRNHKYSVEEYKKVESITNKIYDYLNKVNASDLINVTYFEEIGYLTKVKIGSEIVNIFKVGSVEEEAFFNIIVTYELINAVEYEMWYRDILEKRFFKREEESVYYSEIFYAELVLQSLRKYFEDDIPSLIVEMFEKFVLNSTGEVYNYNYEEDCLIKNRSKINRRFF